VISIFFFHWWRKNCLADMARQFRTRPHGALAAVPDVRRVPRDLLPRPENSLDSTLDEGRAVAAVRRDVSILRSPWPSC